MSPPDPNPEFSARRPYRRDDIDIAKFFGEDPVKLFNSPVWGTIVDIAGGEAAEFATSRAFLRSFLEHLPAAAFAREPVVAIASDFGLRQLHGKSDGLQSDIAQGLADYIIGKQVARGLQVPLAPYIKAAQARAQELAKPPTFRPGVGPRARRRVTERWAREVAENKRALRLFKLGEHGTGVLGAGTAALINQLRGSTHGLWFGSVWGEDVGAGLHGAARASEMIMGSAAHPEENNTAQGRLWGMNLGFHVAAGLDALGNGAEAWAAWTDRLFRHPPDGPRLVQPDMDQALNAKRAHDHQVAAMAASAAAAADRRAAAMTRQFMAARAWSDAAARGHLSLPPSPFAGPVGVLAPTPTRGVGPATAGRAQTTPGTRNRRTDHKKAGDLTVRQSRTLNNQGKGGY